MQTLVSLYDPISDQMLDSVQITHTRPLPQLAQEFNTWLNEQKALGFSRHVENLEFFLDWGHDNGHLTVDRATLIVSDLDLSIDGVPLYAPPS